ncbi:MAG: FAD binding domain-containing protein [Chloroflexi bacterium]|nr:FAD binding domain-containing protein [Chloroflexota bacterium]
MSAELFIPRSLDEALGVLQTYGSGLLVMGGGTMMMAHLNEGVFFPKKVMSLARAGLSGIYRNGHTQIGATTSLSKVSQLGDFPILADAAYQIGGPALRNMGTIGGNLYMPQPAGDMAVPLLTYDAHVELASASNSRTIPLEAFLAEPRSRHGTQELLVAIHLPNPTGRTAYLKLGRREANTPSVVTVGARVVLDGQGQVSDVRIALGAAGSIAFRAKSAEAALVGQALNTNSIADAAQLAMEESDPFTDALATAWYRRRMVGVFVKRTLEQLVK